MATDSHKRSSISKAIANEDQFQAAVKYRLNTDTYFQEAVASNTNLRTEVADNLKGDSGFQKLVTGPQGDKGDPGQDGTSPDPGLVVAQLLIGEKKVH